MAIKVTTTIGEWWNQILVRGDTVLSGNLMAVFGMNWVDECEQR